MLEKRCILFDLDGTITDPKIGITRAVQFALSRFDVSAAPEELLRFIGPPLLDSFREFYGLSAADAARAVGFYREYYGQTGIFECELYPDVQKCLSSLADAGKSLLLATSKPTVYAAEVLRHFALARFFTAICGSELDNTRTDKAEVIEYALETAGISNRATAVMIGDRVHDIIGAKKTGLSSIGAVWGYGGTEELRDAGADLLANSARELAGILLGR